MSQIVMILNTNEDVVELLRTSLENAGIHAVAGHIFDLKVGKRDFKALIDQYDPAVILYDVAPPYRDNWGFLQALLQSQAAEGRQFVVTTANERLLRQIAGESISALEISEKPYDLKAIVDAVRRKLDCASGS